MATFVNRGNSWQVKVRRQGYKPIARTFDTKAAGERWARDVERKMDLGTWVDTTEAERTTLREALQRYEREVTPRKKGAEQERYRIAKWRRDDLAYRFLATIRGVDMAAWRDQQLAAGLSPTTVRNDLALISHLFTVASREWGLESLSNPVKKIAVPAPAKGRERRLQPGEKAKLLEGCDATGSPWMRPLVELALEMAARQGELLNLTWADVGEKKAILRDTKNGETREAPLSTRARDILKMLPRSLDGRVFPLNKNQVTYFFRRATDKAELTDLHFHDLRHEATSRLFEKGFNPMEAATVTGHKTLQMLKRYTHLRAEDLADRLGQCPRGRHLHQPLPTFHPPQQLPCGPSLFQPQPPP